MLTFTVDELRTQLANVKVTQTAIDARCENLHQQLLEVQEQLWHMPILP